MTENVLASEGPSESNPYRHERDDFSRLLSRLASFQGHAVPFHRFSMLEHNRDGADLAGLSVDQQLEEMWAARFPLGEGQRRALESLEPGDYPLLWINDEGDVYLVRGRLARGSFSAEDLAGKETQLLTSEVLKGQLLQLTVESANAFVRHKQPVTANDWFRYAIRKRKVVFFEAVFATFLISILGLVAAFYTMQVYDRVIPSKGFSTLWVLGVGVTLAILFEFIVSQVRAHMLERATKAIDLELSGVFFNKAMDIRMDARPATVGTFASQIRHFETVRNFMTSTVLFVLADVPFAIFFVGVVFLIGGYVAIVPLVMVLLALMTSFILSRPIERLTEEHMKESNRKNGLLIEAIDGVESIKAAGGEWKMLDRYRDLTAIIAESEIQLKMVSARAGNLAKLIQQGNYVGLITVGAYAATRGDLTIGGLIACSIIMGRAFTPITQIPNLVVQWKNAKIALKALDGIMLMDSDRPQHQRLIVPENAQGHIRVENMAFGYSQEHPALSSASLEFHPGERVAVLGAVGSGKSSLIRVLSGLFKPSQGTVYLDSVDIQQLAPEFVREQIGYLPQDVRLFNGTLRENLTLGLPTPSDSRILAAARLTGLEESIQGHPKGLELEISEGGRGLSGGQRQLVGLTRLLLAQPKIMLLDEPTASMDGQLEARVMSHLFQEINPESLLVVVTHKTAILQHVNRILVLDKGRILLDGPRDQVLAKLTELQQQHQKAQASEKD